MDGIGNGEILSQEQVLHLFDDESTTETQETPPVESNDSNGENIENKETTEVKVDVDNLFTDEQPESVGSEETNTKVEDTTSEKDDGTSPKNDNFFSSIASALKEDGIFADLDDETVSNIKNPEDFADAIEKQLQSKFDERQKRIDDALNAGVEASEIKGYENTLSYLDSITEESITDESEKGEKLRKNLIYQDFINRGYSKERAEREVNKSFNSGSDIEDAKDALTGNKEFFQNSYNDLINKAKEEAERETKERKTQAEKLKKSILEDKKVFGDIEIDNNTRKKVFDNISKPVYKDEEGNYYTAIQKYEMENRTEFLKNVGLLYTLTDGFKNIDRLVNGKVKKEVRKGISELEKTLNNTSRTPDGSYKFASGVDDDPNSYFGKGLKLDI